MEKMLSSQERKRLQRIMMNSFKNEIQTLDQELQYMLTDDLVTALKNRLIVFQRIQEKQAFSENKAKKTVV